MQLYLKLVAIYTYIHIYQFAYPVSIFNTK